MDPFTNTDNRPKLFTQVLLLLMSKWFSIYYIGLPDWWPTLPLLAQALIMFNWQDILFIWAGIWRFLSEQLVYQKKKKLVFSFGFYLFWFRSEILKLIGTHKKKIHALRSNDGKFRFVFRLFATHIKIKCITFVDYMTIT